MVKHMRGMSGHERAYHDEVLQNYDELSKHHARKRVLVPQLTEDEKLVRDYMKAHPEAVAAVAVKNGINVEEVTGVTSR